MIPVARRAKAPNLARVLPFWRFVSKCKNDRGEQTRIAPPTWFKAISRITLSGVLGIDGLAVTVSRDVVISDGWITIVRRQRWSDQIERAAAGNRKMNRVPILQKVDGLNQIGFTDAGFASW